MANEIKESSPSPRKEITLKMLWHVFVANLLWICGVAILVAGIAGVYTKFFIKTKYRESMTFYVFNFQSNSDYFSSTQTSAAATGAELCIEAAKKEATLRQLVERRGDELTEVLGTETERQTVSAIAATLGASHEATSAFFEISVTHENKELVDGLMTILEEEYVGIFQSLFSTVDSGSGEKVSVGEIRLYHPAEEPVTVRPSAVRNAVLAGAVAAVLVYAICFIVSLLDNVIYDEQTVKENFTYPILGTVPEWVSSAQPKKKRTAVRRMLRMSRSDPSPGAIERDYEDKLLSKTTPFMITEAFNLLRTNLSYSVATTETPVYVITSANAGAGKSIIAANLALSFAQLGKRTLLVEGDMRMPVFYKIFSEIERTDVGLSELLTGNAEDSREVGKRILNDHLTVISAGRIPPNPADLLAQPRAAALIEEWKRDYDLILIDTPPIGEVSDAGVLSAHTTGYIINVRSEYSDIPSVQSTVSSLRTVDANIVGFVLNDVNYGTHGYHRSYYKKGKYYKNTHYGYYRYSYADAARQQANEQTQK